MNTLKISILILLFLFCSGENRALPLDVSPPVPEGTFLILDDGTGEVRSSVVFYKKGQELRAKISRLKTGHEDARCEKCTGELKNKRLMGMDLIWGLKWDGNRWSGGSILDVDTGKIYVCRINHIGSKKVEVRGYVGTPLFGETLVWPKE